MNADPSRLRALLAELKRRRVYHVAAVYGVVAFVVVEVADIAFPALRLPPWTVTFVVALAVLGFPIALVLAWAFEITPEGVRRTEPVAKSGPDAGSAERSRPVRRRVVLVVIGILILGGGYALYSNYASAPSGDRPEIASLAVLPLENLSRDSAEAYFVDGMTEALITELSRIGALKVISRTSVMRFKGTRQPLPEIARALDVDGLIEGSVLRVGDRVRITVQFIHGLSDRHLWAENYERDVRDIFALQGEVARAIARQIRARLTPEERARLAEGRSVDPEVQESYLRGRYHMARFNEADVRRAIEYFERATTLDSTFAPAYAGLATSWMLLGQPLGAMPHHDAMPRAKSAAETAIRLDPSLAEGHVGLGWVRFLYDWDFSGAEAAFQRAIELNPNSGDAHSAYGLFLSAMGQVEKGIAHGQRAVELDPLNLAARAPLAEDYLLARRYDRAIEVCREILEMDPGFNRARSVLRWAYDAHGEYDKSIALYREAFERDGLEPEEEAALAALERAYAERGARGYWEWRFERFQRFAEGEYVSPASYASYYADLGQKDSAFAWLERAYEARVGSLAFLKTNPSWDGLRPDPRFDELLRRIGLE